MFIAEGLLNIRPDIQSANKCHGSNRRHLARKNHRKKASDEYIPKFRNVVLKLTRSLDGTCYTCKYLFSFFVIAYIPTT